jgi:hypothetical protein
MATRIVIIVNDQRVEADLDDTPSGRAVKDALPIAATPNEWGDEFYFEVPVALPLDGTATTAVKSGDIGYWPPGRALAIFFGPTPMSTGADPVPASAVNRVGRIIGDATVLRQAKGAREIRIEKV